MPFYRNRHAVLAEFALLALTREDFDLEKRTLRINKTYQVVNGEEMTTSPKTEKSNRTIELPQFLCDEMADYFDSIYGLDDTSRIFPVSKSFLHHEMDRGTKESRVKRIRIHDLRHSSCALLVELGYSPVQIADRLGHETVTITDTVIAVVADLAVTMFLAGEIRSVVPVNLMLMQVLLFLGYSGARAWLQHLRAERLYF